MIEISAENLIIILFGFVIVFLLVLIYVMQRRIRTIWTDMDDINSTMQFTCNKLELLSKNVEEFKKH